MLRRCSYVITLIVVTLQIIAAGSRGGTVKLWDLGAEKGACLCWTCARLRAMRRSVCDTSPSMQAADRCFDRGALILDTVVRTLAGHRSSVKAADFHPYGDFFASGSLDTNLKVEWRVPSCLYVCGSVHMWGVIRFGISVRRSACKPIGGTQQRSRQ